MQELQTVRAHACFRLDIQFPIGDSVQLLGDDRDLQDLWQSTSYRIMRSPNDLLAHTRRVRLCQEPALHGRLAGALGDLAYVLGDRGASLQRRLRAECADKLGGTSVLDKAMTLEDDIHSTTPGRVLPTLAQLLQPDNTSGAASSP